MATFGWNKKKSLTKASKAGTGAALGALGGGLSGAGLLTILRLFGIKLWDPSFDVEVVTAASTIASVVGSAIKVYLADKKKHST